MKIYIASSWKNEQSVMMLSQFLRENGHQVDAFTDSSTGRYVFHYSEIGPINELNAINFLKNPKSRKAFKEDKKWLDWCECCVMLLPCGKSSHLEAGYAKGRNKKLAIFQPAGFPKGEFDVMYGFADIITANFIELLEWLSIKENEDINR